MLENLQVQSRILNARAAAKPFWNC